MSERTDSCPVERSVCVDRGIGRKRYLRRVDLRLVEYFISVVDCGGVTKAANQLYIAQPSLSQAVRTLEREVGAELFDRSGRSMTLTPAGKVFEVGARAVIRDAARARAGVAAVRDLRAGRLRIAADSAMALDPLPAAAALLQERHPGIQLSITEPESPSEIVADVRLGRAEIGLTYLDVDTGPLITVPFGDQELGLATAEDRAAGLPNPFPLDRLHEIPLVLGNREGTGDNAVDAAIRSSGATVVVRTAFRQAAWELLQLGVGAAILPVDFARDRIRRVAAIPTDPPLSRPIGAVHRKTPLSPAAKAFMRVVRQPLTQPTPVHNR